MSRICLLPQRGQNRAREESLPVLRAQIDSSPWLVGRNVSVAHLAIVVCIDPAGMMRAALFGRPILFVVRWSARPAHWHMPMGRLSLQATHSTSVLGGNSAIQRAAGYMPPPPVRLGATCMLRCAILGIICLPAGVVLCTGVPTQRPRSREVACWDVNAAERRVSCPARSSPRIHMCAALVASA